jgi:8-amino-3,8-dideoxy-alpha-D-manno-octulosonate transaminase
MPGIELFGSEEKKEILEVLEKGVLFRYNFEKERNGIWKAREFEKEFAEYHGVKHCHFCSSGTAADLISLAACGIGAGDEVILSPFSFIAPVEAVLSMGAVPVFAEIDETLCLSPEGIKKAITPNTKAVMLVHVFGSMAQISEIAEICNENNIILIEDAAPALGASYKNAKAGSFGKIAAYSFDFFKIITAAEGGAIITNDDDIYEAAHMYSDHGHDHIGNNRGAEQHPVLGLNFRNSELHAAVALAQFRKLDSIIEKQKQFKVRLQELFSGFEALSFRDIPDKEGDSATFFSFFTPNENTCREIHQKLGENGVGTAYWYNNNFHYLRNWDHLKAMKTVYPLHQFRTGVPEYSELKLPATNHIMKRMQMIEIRLSWSDEQFRNMLEIIEKTLKSIL